MSSEFAKAAIRTNSPNLATGSQVRFMKNTKTAENVYLCTGSEGRIEGFAVPGKYGPFP